MQVRLLLYISITVLFQSVKGQNPEDISFGFFGRTEQNIYRYYAEKSKGDFYTNRVNNGYCAGLVLRSTINYLLNAGLSVGLSEASYSPSIKKDNSTLWTTHLLLWQYDLWGELKLGNKEKTHPVIIVGLQVLSVYRKSEQFSNGRIDALSWPETRALPRIGLGYDIRLGKKQKWQLEPYAGLRLALKNKLGYDYVMNQFFAGLNFTRRIKSW